MLLLVCFGSWLSYKHIWLTLRPFILMLYWPYRKLSMKLFKTAVTWLPWAESDYIIPSSCKVILDLRDDCSEMWKICILEAMKQGTLLLCSQFKSGVPKICLKLSVCSGDGGGGGWNLYPSPTVIFTVRWFECLFIRKSSGDYFLWGC